MVGEELRLDVVVSETAAELLLESSELEAAVVIVDKRLAGLLTEADADVADADVVDADEADEAELDKGTGVDRVLETAVAELDVLRSGYAHHRKLFVREVSAIDHCLCVIVQ